MRSTRTILAAALLAIAWATPSLAFTHGVSAQIFTVTCHNIDDSATINAALDAAIAAETSGQPAAIYVPTGQCNYKTPHATMIQPVSIYGDGSAQSIINVDPSLSGDVFSWSQTWLLTRYGVQVVGVGLTGNTSAASQQNGLVFYDRNDFVYMSDVFIKSLNGKCLSSGHLKSTTVGWLRESNFYSIHAWNCGQAGVPAVEFYSEAAGGDATNEIKVFGLDIFGPVGPGLVFANNNVTQAIRLSAFYGLRIECAVSPACTGSPLSIGDGVAPGGITGLSFFSTQLTDNPAGTTALLFQAPNATAGARIFGLDFYDLSIGPSAGKGIDIEAGRGLNFNIIGLTTTDTNITVGPTSNGVGNGVQFAAGNGNATIGAWTTSIDASMTSNVHKPTIGSFP